MKNIGLDLRMLGNRHGGIGRYCFEIAQHILRQDQKNHYTLFVNKKNTENSVLEQFQHFNNSTIIEANVRHYSILEQTSFLRALNNADLDLMHFPNFNMPIYYKKPFVVTIHDMVHHKIGGAKKTHFFHFQAYKKVITTAAQNAQKIITVSQYSKEDIIKYLNVPSEKIEVIYEGTSLPTHLVSDDQIMKIKQSFLLSRPYLLFVGVLERKKNIINLTRGFDEFIKKYNINIDLVIAGPADKHYPDIKYKALDIKNKDRVIFTGFLEDSELAALYKGAHAFVSASLHEGFGLPGVEAMHSGLPLVVSNIKVFNEIYDDAAIYFNPLDPSDIAEKINLLVRDAQFHLSMQKKSIARSQHFSWEKAAEETLAVYNKVVGELT